MARSGLPLLIAALLAGLVASCSRFDHAERPAWRDQAEEACLAKHLVEATPAIQPARAIGGPGICGLNHPFKVYALADGTVKLNTPSLLDCSMIPVLDDWIKTTVQPDALARFGEPVVQIDTMGTYSCRGINNQSGASLSEHAFANAIDVGGFVLASGRQLNVMRGWKSADVQESAFLHDAHAGACSTFTTVLGPGANIFHYNHVHLDLAMHGNTSRGPRRYCKPVPDEQVAAPRLDNLPDPPPIEEEMDMAQSPVPPPDYSTGAGRSFVASVPESAPVYHPAAPRGSDGAGESAPLALVPLPHRPVSESHAPDGDAENAAPDTAPATWDITSLINSGRVK